MKRPLRLAGYFLVGVCSILPMKAATLDPEVGVGSWIWDAKFSDRQECHFVRAFTIPEGVKVLSATLRITADNSYHLFLDGQSIGQGGDWRVLIEYDVRELLGPGEHVLAVSAVNDFDVAGLLVGLRINLSDGQVIEIGSDTTWRIAPEGMKSWTTETLARPQWPAATLLAPLYEPNSHPQVYRAPVSKPVEVALWQRGWFQAALSLVAVTSVAVGIFLASRLILKSQMEKVVRRERARIAMDLHDELGGGLTQLVLLGETSRQGMPSDTPAAKSLGRLCAQSRGLLRGMNETVWLINSQRDTIRDFASYVARHAESFFQDSGVRCHFHIEADLPPLPCDLGIRRNLFLAVKEALHNIIRHAQATSAEVTICRQRQHLSVTIHDNGRGFPADTESTGNGLRNMRLRAAEAGGSFSMKSDPAHGTTLEFRVPLRPPVRLRFARFFRWPSTVPPAEQTQQA